MQADKGAAKQVPYLGDVLFERLNNVPGFLATARTLVSADWRTGTNSFRQYVTPLLDDIFINGDFSEHVGFDFSYLERRVMSDILDLRRTPWLWAYGQMTGACLAPDMVRAALNAIADGREG